MDQLFGIFSPSLLSKMMMEKFSSLLGEHYYSLKLIATILFDLEDHPLEELYPGSFLPEHSDIL
jgi:hypothetical protein